MFFRKHSLLKGKTYFKAVLGDSYPFLRPSLRDSYLCVRDSYPFLMPFLRDSYLFLRPFFKGFLSVFKAFLLRDSYPFLRPLFKGFLSFC